MEKHNTVHAIFASGAKAAEIIDDVWQYDFGQTLQIEGLSLPPTIEVHYANKGRDTAIPQVGVTKDGITTAPIPNEILSEKGAFTAYIFVTDGKSGETCYTITGYINKRPALKEFDTPEEQEMFHEAIEAVNKAAERAESAEVKATEAASQASEDAAQTSKDREEVERLVESVSGIGEQVTKVENLTKQAQTSATNAALSEQAAKTAETNAQAAQAGAETAEGNAELAERNVKASEQAVEKAKQLVTQMGQEVLDNKNHVDQTVQAFDQTAQQAVANVNNAGQTQTERVQSAGNTAVESVKTAQTAATKAVETAKTEAVEAVQTEGTTQTANVTAEGTKQVQAVQQAAQEIVADREQIAQNKADIAEIKEEIGNLSPAIIDTATGESIVVEDSSGNKFRGSNVYGKSTQATTTEAQLLNTEELITGYYDASGGITNLDSRLSAPKIHIPTGTTKISISGLADNISALYVIQNAESGVIDRKVGCKKQHIISVTPESKTIGVSFYNDDGIKITADMLSSCMINFGDIKPWEPYTGGKPSPSVEYPQEIANAGDKGNIGIDVYGGNFLNITNAKNDKLSVTIKNNMITVEKLIATNTVFDSLVYNFTLRAGSYILCCDSFMNFSFLDSGNRCDLYTVSDTGRKFLVALHERGALKKQFSIDKDENIQLDIRAGYKEAGKSYTIKGLRLTAVKELQWESYKPVQTLTIPTPNGLPGIKVDSGGNYTDSTGQHWVCDEIDLERGKYVQRVYKCKKEDLTIVKWSNNEYFIIASNVPIPNTVKALCNITSTYSSSWINKDYSHYFLQEKGQKVIIALGKKYCNSMEEMQKVLDAGIDFRYILKEPIEHDLPPEVIEAYKKLHTNYPVTTVLNDAGAGMVVEYVADTKNYTDNKIAESVKNQMQNLTNLLSLMPMETQAAMIENDVNRILESEVTK